MRVPSLEHIDLRGCSKSSSGWGLKLEDRSRGWPRDEWQAPAGTLKGRLWLVSEVCSQLWMIMVKSSLQSLKIGRVRQEKAGASASGSSRTSTCRQHACADCAVLLLGRTCSPEMFRSEAVLSHSFKAMMSGLRELDISEPVPNPICILATLLPNILEATPSLRRLSAHGWGKASPGIASALAQGLALHPVSLHSLSVGLRRTPCISFPLSCLSPPSRLQSGFTWQK
jgi:hypothetical protein